MATTSDDLTNTSNSTDDSAYSYVDDFDDNGAMAYRPNAPVVRWHQNMELIFICVCNGLSTILILTRTWLKFRRIKRLRHDDYWVLAGGFLLVAPLWISQIATNRYGNGLHTYNVPPEWYQTYWDWETGWISYHVVVSLIKIGVVIGLSEIIPKNSEFRFWRIFLWVFSGVICVFGFLVFFLLIFACSPLQSNFNLNIAPDSCLNTDIVRYAWSAISIVFDIIICYIPFVIINKLKMNSAAKKILFLMSFSTLLGLVTCGVSIYGEYLSSTVAADMDFFWTGSPWVICNVCETLAYTIGAFLPLLSPYIIQKQQNPTQSKSADTTLMSKAVNRLPRFKRAGGNAAKVEKSPARAPPAGLMSTSEVTLTAGEKDMYRGTPRGTPAPSMDVGR